jgi:hypothetical protein
LSEELADLEIESCRDMIDHENEDLIKSSKAVRKRLTDAADAQHKQLSQHLIQNSNAKAGIITWLTPNRSI